MTQWNSCAPPHSTQALVTPLSQAHEAAAALCDTQELSAPGESGKLATPSNVLEIVNDWWTHSHSCTARSGIKLLRLKTGIAPVSMPLHLQPRTCTHAAALTGAWLGAGALVALNRLGIKVAEVRTHELASCQPPCVLTWGQLLDDRCGMPHPLLPPCSLPGSSACTEPQHRPHLQGTTLLAGRVPGQCRDMAVGEAW